MSPASPDDSAGLVIAIQVVQHHIDLVAQRTAEGIALIRTIQGQDGNAPVLLVDQVLEVHQDHSIVRRGSCRDVPELQASCGVLLSTGARLRSKPSYPAATTRSTIGEVTAAPVTTLINTHHHGDHTFGNSLFDGATIVAHENTRTALLAFGGPPPDGIWEPIEWGPIALAPPTLTFADRVRVWADDLPMDVTHVGGPAHTDNDSIIWLPEERVLFCGDLLFNGGTPFVLMGSVTGAVRVLTEILAPIPAETIVPGHGRPCTPALIDTVLGYLHFVLDLAERGRAAGLTPLDLARQANLGEYTEWLDAVRIVGNLHRAYADLDPASEPLDVFSALGDMVAYNGGHPLTCYA